MPVLSDAKLECFWQAAASPTPLVILGGGRWGRIWSVAASRARGSGKGITIAARTDVAATRGWAGAEPEVAGIQVADSLSEALEQESPPVVAIVASRPRDHVRDGLAALSRGLDVLVEKPISDRAGPGAELLAFARAERRLLAVDTEFALLPAFHECAPRFSGADASLRRIRLYWDDPYGDFRYGAVKQRHYETGILVDLLPHACSIFRVFAGDAALHIESLHQDTGSERAWLRLRDERGGQYELHCDKQSSVRRRLLEAETPGRSLSIDFATEIPSVVIDGVAHANPATLHMRSTLRLALGALLAERAGLAGPTPLSAGIGHLLDLQAELEARLG